MITPDCRFAEIKIMKVTYLGQAGLMFDEITADEFDCEKKIIANIYKEIRL